VNSQQECVGLEEGAIDCTGYYHAPYRPSTNGKEKVLPSRRPCNAIKRTTTATLAGFIADEILVNTNIQNLTLGNRAFSCATKRFLGTKRVSLRATA